jgi:hypothetical protein
LESYLCIVLYCFSSSPTYIYCENAISNSDGTYEFETKDYYPRDCGLQIIVSKLKAESEREGGSIPWKKYLAEAIETLQADTSETDFSQPPLDSDKLYMAIGQQDVIEVAHPSPLPGSDVPTTRRCVCRPERLMYHLERSTTYRYYYRHSLSDFSLGVTLFILKNVMLGLLS